MKISQTSVDFCKIMSLLEFMRKKCPKKAEESKMEVEETPPTYRNLPAADFQTLYDTIKNISNDDHWKQYGTLLGALNKALTEVEIMSHSFSKVKK